MCVVFEDRATLYNGTVLIPTEKCLDMSDSYSGRVFKQKSNSGRMFSHLIGQTKSPTVGEVFLT